VLGVERGFWIAVALAALEIEEDREVIWLPSSLNDNLRKEEETDDASHSFLYSSSLEQGYLAAQDG